jgi:RNA polymerase sigma-70 factor (ECF subfamily)
MALYNASGAYMEATAVIERANAEGWPDEDVVARVLAGETELYEIIMRRYNQRLYRVARSILRNDGEAEDVMQDAYVRAYEHLDQFAGRSRFSAWITKIAVHESLARVQKRNRLQELEAMMPQQEEIVLTSPTASPEQQASSAEMGHLLEEGILALPENYRTVIMMRDIEEMSTADTALALNLSEENVKIRLHRARILLRKELFARAGASRAKAFPFMGAQCDRMVQRVFAAIAKQAGKN